MGRMGFSFAFFVPMAWDWFGEGGDHVRVWGWCFLFTLATGGTAQIAHAARTPRTDGA